MPSPTDRLLTRPATLLERQPAGEDGYGDQTFKVVSRDVVCELQWAGSREEHEDGTQVSTWRLWLPAEAADLRGWDAVRTDDGVYELNGDPWPVRHPRTGLTHHVEAYCTRLGLFTGQTYTELGDDYEIYKTLTDTGESYDELRGDQDEWLPPEGTGELETARKGAEEWLPAA